MEPLLTCKLSSFGTIWGFEGTHCIHPHQGLHILVFSWCLRWDRQVCQSLPGQRKIAFLGACQLWRSLKTFSGFPREAQYDSMTSGSAEKRPKQHAFSKKGDLRNTAVPGLAEYCTSANSRSSSDTSSSSSPLESGRDQQWIQFNKKSVARTAECMVTSSAWSLAFSARTFYFIDPNHESPLGDVC